MTGTDRKDDLAAVLFFLLWAEQHDPTMMFGGYEITEVVDAFANIMGWPKEDMRNLL